MGKSKGKMRSKTKIGVRKPPLSVIDILIYLAGFIFAVATTFGLPFFCIWLRDLIAFSNPAVVAVTGKAEWFWLAIIMFCWGFGSIGFLGRKFSARQPIFGNSKVTYGAFPWKKDLFPLFGFYPEKEKLKKYTYEIRKKRKERMMTLCLWLAVSLLLLGYGGLTGANLKEDHSITVFHISDASMMRVYTPEDFEKLMLNAHYHSGGKSSGYWDYSIRVEMKDGTSRTFCSTDFKRNAPDRYVAALEAMTEIKGLFPPEAITIQGEDKVGYLAESYDYNARQAQMLRELFTME